MGVFFINAGGKAIPVTRHLTQNDLKTLIAIMLTLPGGQYTLRVVTRFTSAANLLREPRIIEYDRLLTVL